MNGDLDEEIYMELPTLVSKIDLSNLYEAPF